MIQRDTNIAITEAALQAKEENFVKFCKQDIDWYVSTDDDPMPPDSEIVALVSGSINECSESDDNAD